MLCTKCNTYNDSDAGFCVNCGNAFNKHSEYQEITIGRTTDNTIQINHPKISSHHAIIKIDKGNIRIEDLNSSNGIYVNGNKVMICHIRLEENTSQLQ